VERALSKTYVSGIPPLDFFPLSKGNQADFVSDHFENLPSFSKRGIAQPARCEREEWAAQ
jgi:hypothetical protein